MTRIGYARVSTTDHLQVARLTAEGCENVRSEKASGLSRRHSELEAIVAFLRRR